MALVKKLILFELCIYTIGGAALRGSATKGEHGAGPARIPRPPRPPRQQILKEKEAEKQKEKEKEKEKERKIKKTEKEKSPVGKRA